VDRVRQTPRDSVTPETLWLRRREWLGAAGAALWPLAAPAGEAPNDTPTAFEWVTRHNNYYEFSPQKDVIWKLAEDFKTVPWTLRVEGEVEKPLTLTLEALLARFTVQDRVYRLRCVEGWSAVIPWRGIELRHLLAVAVPTARARFVAFESVLRPSEMIGQRTGALPWPYREGFRLDEAMHPLTMLATGMYGAGLPAQNGGPLRLVVPWKYGFKSAKAVVAIRLISDMPPTSWQQKVPSEYGFYANVNPDVAHPRWSQRRELRLGELAKRPTLPFNGYADAVQSLYAGMDLVRHF
jgi:methionine sulfoxide reductase catalytic subunit